MKCYLDVVEVTGEVSSTADAYGHLYARCGWCGTDKSHNWVSSHYGGNFCTRDCACAHCVGRDFGIVVMAFFFPLLGFVIPINPDLILAFLGGSMMMLCCFGFPALYISARGYRVRRRVPKGSER